MSTCKALSILTYLKRCLQRLTYQGLLTIQKSLTEINNPFSTSVSRCPNNEVSNLVPNNPPLLYQWFPNSYTGVGNQVSMCRWGRGSKGTMAIEVLLLLGAYYLLWGQSQSPGGTQRLATPSHVLQGFCRQQLYPVSSYFIFFEVLTTTSEVASDKRKGLFTEGLETTKEPCKRPVLPQSLKKNTLGSDSTVITAVLLLLSEQGHSL